LLREPGKPIDPKREQSLNIATLHWAKPQERPTLLARTTQWMKPVGATAGQVAAATALVPAVLRLGIDIYNPSDNRPADNFLRFASAPYGWDVRPQPITIPSLATYRVQRFYLDAKIDPTRVVNSDRRPVELTFTNGFDNRNTPLKVVIPTAVCDRLPPGLNLNGSLEDWSADDVIQDGPLIAM